MAIRHSLIFSLIFLATGGCLLKPKEAEHESQLLAQYADIYEGQRTIPALPDSAAPIDILTVAFYSNGDLEAAYYNWKAAIARINIESVWPNSNIQFSFGYLFSKDKLKAWDRTTLGATFDPAAGLTLPMKTEKAGQIAFNNAVSARNAFQSAKFDLQNRVLNAYLDLVELHEKIDIQKELISLLELNLDVAKAQFEAGGNSPEFLRMQVEYRTAQRELQTLETQSQSAFVGLNALLGRKPKEDLSLNLKLPTPRGALITDETWFTVSVDNNPQLASLQSDISSKVTLLQLAKMKYLPDINPTFSITGSMSQALGAMAMLPTNLPAIEASIKEADANLQGALASARQKRTDKNAQFVSALYFLRNAESQIQFIDKTVFPLARGIAENIQQSYTTGQSSLADLLLARKTLIEIRASRLSVLIERERRLADLETLCGLDVETLETHHEPQPQNQ